MLEIYKKLKKYNYWAGTGVKTGFLRVDYQKKIEPYLGNSLIKVLVGQRRAGKSYVLRQLIHRLIQDGVKPGNIFYLNKELVEFDEISNYKQLAKLIEFYRQEMKVKGKIFILLDEIQEIQGWEKIVNSLSQNHNQQSEVFITGSNSTMLSSELATYLSGRYVSFEVLPFSFSEYLACKKLARNKENFLAYLKSGGLPELFQLTGEETKIHYVSSLKDTVMLKDIVGKYKIKDSQLLDNVFKFVTDNIGNLFSTNSIVSYLTSHKIKTNHETISNYVSYLTQTYLIHCVERYDIKGKEIFSASKKYYLNDLAFRNFLSSDFDYGLGKHLENVIYLHFRRLGYKIYVGSIAGEEIDFVVEKDGDRKYLQVAYSLAEKKVADREFRGLEKIGDSYEKLVVSLDDVSFGNKNGIRHVSAWNFV